MRIDPSLQYHLSVLATACGVRGFSWRSKGEFKRRREDDALFEAGRLIHTEGSGRDDTRLIYLWLVKAYGEGFLL